MTFSVPEKLLLLNCFYLLFICFLFWILIFVQFVSQRVATDASRWKKTRVWECMAHFSRACEGIPLPGGANQSSELCDESQEGPSLLLSSSQHQPGAHRRLAFGLRSAMSNGLEDHSVVCVCEFVCVCVFERILSSRSGSDCRGSSLG